MEKYFIMVQERDSSRCKVMTYNSEEGIDGVYTVYSKEEIIHANFTVEQYFEKQCSFMLLDDLGIGNKIIRDIKDEVLEGKALEGFMGDCISWDDMRAALNAHPDRPLDHLRTKSNDKLKSHEPGTKFKKGEGYVKQ